MPRIYLPDGSQRTVSEKEMADAAAKGQWLNVPEGTHINTVDPENGSVGTIPYSIDAIKNAFVAGYRFETPEEEHKAWLKQEYGGTGGALTAGLLGLARGATLGISDVFARHILDPREMAAWKEYNPITSGVTEVVGAIAPSLATGGVGGGAELAAKYGTRLGGKMAVQTAKQASKAKGFATLVAQRTPSALIARKAIDLEKVLAKALKVEISSGASKAIRKAAAATLAYGAEGAAWGAGTALSEAAIQDKPLTAEHLFTNIGMGAVLGGTVGGGPAALAYVTKQVLKPTVKVGTKIYGTIEKHAPFTRIQEKIIDGLMGTRIAPLVAGKKGLTRNLVREEVEKTTRNIDNLAHDFTTLQNETDDIQRALEGFARGTKVKQKPFEKFTQKQAKGVRKALNFVRKKAGMTRADMDEAMKAAKISLVDGTGEDALLGIMYSQKPGVALNLEAQAFARREIGMTEKQARLFATLDKKEAAEFAKMSKVDALEYGKGFKDTLDELAGELAPVPAPLRPVYHIKNEHIRNLDAMGNEVEILGVARNVAESIRGSLDDMVTKIAGEGAAVAGQAEQSALIREARKLVSKFTARVEKARVKPGYNAKIFALTDDLQNGLRSIASRVKQSEATTDLFKGASETLGTAYGKLTDYLGDQRLFGPGAELKKKMGTSWLRWFGKKKESTDYLFADLGTANTTARIEKMRRVLRDTRDGFKEADYRKFYDLPDDVLKRFTKLNENTARLTTKLDDLETLGAKRQALQAEELKRVRGRVGTAAGLGIAAAGLLGPGLLGIGATSGSLLRMFGAKMALGQTGMVRTILQKSKRYIDKTIKETVGRKSAKHFTVPILVLGQDAYQNVYKELQGIVSDPVKAQERISNNLGKLGNDYPEVAMHASTTAQTAAAYLLQEAPRPPVSNNVDTLRGKHGKIVDRELDAFARKLHIVENPLVVLDMIRNGTVKKADWDTIKAVYPNMAQQFTEGIVDELAHTKETPDYQTLMHLSLVLGQDLHASLAPGYVAKLQQSFIPAGPAGPGTQGEQKKKTKKDRPIKKMVASELTATQGLEARI